ncbi:MAG: hypothetical protein IJV58_02240, partial [Oscillospiraceae bacterium]|nr:hypothetical protein [Oscillospiraceae bacterium]
SMLTGSGSSMPDIMAAAEISAASFIAFFISNSSLINPFLQPGVQMTDGCKIVLCADNLRISGAAQAPDMCAISL